MKIGIVTFHWATNYGAVLQSFVLLKTLQTMGHDVEIINYKPNLYDYSLWNFIRLRRFLHPLIYLNSLKKEYRMLPFRKKYLNCSKRFTSIKQLQKECDIYDVLISGSDQVMNPYFLAIGESGNASTAYFLDFGRKDTIRITYAVSFGTTKYPVNLLPVASPLIKRFSALSVRETTGKAILASMGRDDVVVVPDPTILFTAEDYDKNMGLNSTTQNDILVYMLHNRLSAIQSRLPNKKMHIITSESIEEWVQAIKVSKYLITNSFHGMVFAIIFHIPFTIVLSSTCNEGMNDRFFTLLGQLGLLNRIMSETDYEIDGCNIDWVTIDKRLEEIRILGINFLINSIK